MPTVIVKGVGGSSITVYTSLNPDKPKTPLKRVSRDWRGKRNG